MAVTATTAVAATGHSTSSNGSTGYGGDASCGGPRTTADDHQTITSMTTPPTMVISGVTPPPASPRATSPALPTQPLPVLPPPSLPLSLPTLPLPPPPAPSLSSQSTAGTAITAPAQHSVLSGYTPPVSGPSSPVTAAAPASVPAHPPLVSRRDSTTQVSDRNVVVVTFVLLVLQLQCPGLMFFFTRFQTHVYQF